MFEKLLSNLPYNPSLVHQLGFYAKRMHRETAIRRTGMVFVVLSFFIQFFAVAVPPQSTVAYSNNDMINGGIQSQSEAVNTCKQNIKNYGDVLADFGISCSDVANASVIQALSSTSHNKNLYSMGWLPQGKTNNTTGKTTGEVPLNLDNVSETLYARYLWSWDTGDHSDYKALQVTASTGKTYFILFSCGNLVSIGQPVPVVKKTATSTPTSTPNTPSPSFANPTCVGLAVKGIGVRSYTFTDTISNTASSFAINSYYFDFGDSSPTANVKTTSTTASVSHTYAAPGTYTIKASAAGTLTYLSGWHGPTAVVCQASLTVGNTVITNPPTITTTPMCKYNPSLPADSTDCKPCDKAVSSADSIACIVPSKTAANQTQNIANADGTTAQASDVIVYTLHAANSGKDTVQQFTMQENLSDVLDYATVKDLDGGTMDGNDIVSWPAQDIAAGNTETHTITVQVKNPIPNDPPAPSDPAHFDHVMTNVYGNAINIKLPGGVITAVSNASTALPNTGPGTSLAITGAIVIVAGYFFARARLLAEETAIAVQQTANHGGM